MVRVDLILRSFRGSELIPDDPVISFQEVFDDQS
ncbi:hypothetical protein COLO4_25374 [Corchorus olitorius]|uniref:Uncharacterized protein n=1 Tax=Corchorus olitorius TaxID=93759 RepID=A0A1R3I3A5_9ROSI|nr:hypothetical protein COLO4_25374 [Corchorus olitorius]